MERLRVTGDLKPGIKYISVPEKEYKQIIEALQEYGWHKDSCAYVQGLRGNSIEECDCGFSKALKKK